MKYAGTYSRRDRAVWYITYPDAMTGKRKQRATVYRKDDPLGRKKAFDEAVQLTKEAQALRPAVAGESWDLWVPQWMTLNLVGRARQRYEGAWKHIHFFLTEQRLPCPRVIEYAHADRYLRWRTAQRRRRGTLINYNTALTELKIWSSVMREGVRRGFAQGNPFGQLGLGRQNVREKPEMTDEEIAKIRSELKSRPSWMSDCFEVAIHQGCRLMETAVPLSAVDLARGTITFKGKGNKVFTTSIHPGLRPMVEAKKKVGAGKLADLPPMPAKLWWQFFREVDLPHLCFHSTRVTVVTRMCRAGVPQGVAMSYVGHSSELVHRVYQRLTLPDQASALRALSSIGATP